MQSPISSHSEEETNGHIFAHVPCVSPASVSSSPSTIRLWRPAAQKNLRNQWSKLLSSKRQWESVASEGRTSATGFVNAYLSRRYLPGMNLGVLRDMVDIQQMALEKLDQKQEQCQRKLVSSYKGLVDIVCQMVEVCESMRCFLKGSSASPLLQFTQYSEDEGDSGDGGGIAVFTFWPLSHFDVNIETKRVDEIFAMVEEEMKVKL